MSGNEANCQETCHGNTYVLSGSYNHFEQWREVCFQSDFTNCHLEYRMQTNNLHCPTNQLDTHILLLNWKKTP